MILEILAALFYLALVVVLAVEPWGPTDVPNPKRNYGSDDA